MSETDLMILEILLRKANAFPSRQNLKELKVAQLTQDLINNCLNSKSTEFMLGVILGMNLVITRLQNLTQYYDNTEDVKEKETSKGVSSLSNMLALFAYASRLVICSRKREKRNWFNEAIRSIFCGWFYTGFGSPLREQIVFHRLIHTAYPYPVISMSAIDGESLVYQDISPNNFKKLVFEMRQYLKYEPSELLKGLCFSVSLCVSGLEFIRTEFLKDLRPSHTNISGYVRDVHHWLLALLTAGQETIENRSKRKQFLLKIFHSATEGAIFETCKNIKHDVSPPSHNSG